jgi:hypothetical protein
MDEFDRYEAAVSEAMLKEYGVTWRDACGDREPLERAMAEGLSPEAFVRYFGERYDLIPMREWLRP